MSDETTAESIINSAIRKIESPFVYLEHMSSGLYTIILELNHEAAKRGWRDEDRKALTELADKLITVQDHYFECVDRLRRT